MRLCGWALLLMAPIALAQDVLIEALLPGLAVMQIDGTRVTLRTGQAHGSVKLISADSQVAVLEIDGSSQRLGVSQRINAQFSQPEKRQLSVSRDVQLQYRVNAEINGVRMPVIVDTGANIVALNSVHAAALGIAPQAGTAMQVQTAGSLVAARRVTLDSVDVGGILVTSVDATVIEGKYPESVLLGMSYLKHVDLQESGGVMTLTARW